MSGEIISIPSIIWFSGVCLRWKEDYFLCVNWFL